MKFYIRTVFESLTKKTPSLLFMLREEELYLSQQYPKYSDEQYPSFVKIFSEAILPKISSVSPCDLA
jgi:hypothetical protein